MEEQSGNEWMAYIDGIPVAYYQTHSPTAYPDDMEGNVDPIDIDGAGVDQSYIQWPDGTGVSVQLHHPPGWSKGGSDAYDFYLAMQRLVQAAVLGADTEKLWDYADDLQ